MKPTYNGWELDSDDNRALKHTNKKELWHTIKMIELSLLRLTGNQMSYTEKDIVERIGKLNKLYFK